MAGFEEKFREALGRHRAGDLRTAEVGYREILALDPKHVNALHMMGILASQVGRNDIASQFFEQTLALMQDGAGAAMVCAELGEVYRRLGELEKAAGMCERAVGLDEKLFDGHYNLGVVRQQEGKAAEAVAAYERAVAIDGERPAALYNLGNAYKARGELGKAMDAYHRAIAVKPDYAEALGNLGLTFLEMGNVESAKTAFRAVLGLTPADPVAHHSLGKALEASGDVAGAIAAHEKAIALKPDYAVAHNNLGKLLHDAGKLQEAIGHYRQAIAAAPERAEPYQNLGMALEKIGVKREAAEMYRKAMERGVASPEAHYHMAAVTGMDVPMAAPAAHVISLFDQFAEKFDEHLVKHLEYRTPQLLRDAVFKVMPGATGLDILDLGCGTGLCGPLFRSHARRLVGVDLSPKMVEKAREKGVYDELLVDEIVGAMRARVGQFDLLIAADVLVYFGDLAGVFAGARETLKAGAVFAFSVEAGGDLDFELRPTRRYVHSEKYLRRLAGEKGFAVVFVSHVALRKENDRAVEGYIGVLRVVK